jgi:hypothetical protein
MLRHRADRTLVWAVCGLGLSAAALATGLGAACAATPYAAPRNEFGQPDFEGVWNNASITRLEREDRYGDQLNMSSDEVKAIESQIQNGNKEANKPTAANATVQDVNANCEIPRFAKGVGCGYNNGWIDQGDTVMRVGGQPRTSFITSTANGRLPAYQPGKTFSRNRRRESEDPEAGPAGAADNPEDRSLGERCLLSFGNASGPVMLPRLYNNNYQFMQTRDEFDILVEMVHDIRHIHLNATKHPPSSVRPWMGDSIGHWEGDTLVVETTNFPEAQAKQFYGASENIKVSERLKRVSPTRILYQFKVEDPTIWQQPWGGEYEFSSAPGPVYEYACHEGNYGLEGILAGARSDEAVKQAAAGNKSNGQGKPN